MTRKWFLLLLLLIALLLACGNGGTVSPATQRDHAEDCARRLIRQETEGTINVRSLDYSSEAKYWVATGEIETDDHFYVFSVSFTLPCEQRSLNIK